jgi:2-polyprenyl-3-methyl-5-hydroxy-6-metoxy-1,4-benzoquinol methylase
MPSLNTNKEHWATYDWPQQGDEWSVAWGGSEYLWWCSIFPRIMSFVPTGTILEIAPGYGRCTEYLKDLCQRLIVVDLTERCIEACQRRFTASPHIEYHVNDGRSLAAVPDGAVDLAFSYDSLVHVEADILRAYVQQLASKLTPDGVAFIHHSNLAAIVGPLPPGAPPPDIHWRAHDMSAALFERFCGEAGLVCVGQELVNWGGERLIDCFSLCARPGSRFARAHRVVENPAFMGEADRARRLAEHYGAASFRPAPPARPRASLLTRLAARLGRRAG